MTGSRMSICAEAGRPACGDLASGHPQRIEQLSRRRNRRAPEAPRVASPGEGTQRPWPREIPVDLPWRWTRPS
eukprot:7207573-Prymnesium_polylepis.1